MSAKVTPTHNLKWHGEMIPVRVLSTWNDGDGDRAYVERLDGRPFVFSHPTVAPSAAHAVPAEYLTEATK